MDELNTISTLPAYLVAGLLLVAIWLDVRHDLCRLVTGRNVVLCAIASWYLVEAIMLPDELRKYDQQQYDLGLFHVFLAGASFLVVYHGTSGCPYFTRLCEKITFFDDEAWAWRLVLIGAAIGFAPILYVAATQLQEMLTGMMGMRATWGGVLGRGRYGDARAAFLMLELFVSGVAPFAAILLFSQKSSLVQRLFCLLVVVWPVLRAFGTGTRGALLTASACLVAVCYWKAARTLRKKMIIGVIACAPLVYGLMSAIVNTRSTGANPWEAHENLGYVGNEMFRELLFITSKFPEAMDYQHGYPYLVQLVNPVPRFLWPDKPKLGTGRINAALRGFVTEDGEEWVSISPGLIGEMYMNFGVLGIICLSAFGGWLVRGWDRIPVLFGHSLPALMYYSVGLGALFIMGLSFSMPMFYGLLSLAGLAWLIRSFSAPATTFSVE